ncbi:hypothetical protein IG631_08891 [Alternaria alternata]|nr:hypothetical protein IG631_08891 [Alternaria alternata]
MQSYRTKGASCFEDGLRLTPTLVCTITCTCTCIGLFVRPIIPRHGNGSAELFGPWHHLCLEDSRCWPRYLNDKKRILHHLRLLQTACCDCALGLGSFKASSTDSSCQLFRGSKVPTRRMFLPLF